MQRRRLLLVFGFIKLSFASVIKIARTKHEGTKQQTNSKDAQI